MLTDKRVLQYFARLDREAREILDTAHPDKVFPDTILVAEDKVFTWGKEVLHLLRTVFGKDSQQYRRFSTVYHGDNYLSSFKEYQSVFQQIYQDYENALIRTHTLEDLIEQAETLLLKGQKEGASMMAGMALETALRELCKHNPDIPEEICNNAEEINFLLHKFGSYNRHKLDQIAHWLVLRKKASTGRFNEFTDQDIKSMIDGITRFVKDYLR